MKVKERSEIKDEFKWNLATLFKSDEEWEKEFAALNSEKNLILKFKGKLSNEKELLKCLNTDTKQGGKLSNLFVYAKMKQDEDGAVVKYQAMCDKCRSLTVAISTNSSFIIPEINLMERERILEISELKEFSDYSYALSEIARNKEHSLSEKEEKILAQAGSFAEEFKDAFNMFDNVDIRFQSFVNSNGENIELSHGLYGAIMHSDNREDRKKAFDSMFTAYKNAINFIARIYSGNVKTTWFFAKTRGFVSSLAKAMNAENVNPLVYELLIKSVHSAIPDLNEYLEYRKKALDLDELHMYDMHVPAIAGANRKYTYEDAKKIIKEGLEPLGEEYAELLNNAFNNRWIDVYENKNKRSGAYSWGTYDSNPFILLNFNGELHDVFTIAHELGHSIHSYYSNHEQPRPKSGYEIFVAEIASTVNETLLLKDLLSKTKDKQLEKYLLSYYLDTFRTTVFRQTQFAEFEVKAHEMAEKDLPMTADTLSEIYYDLNKTYYPSAVSDELIKYEWARIPHFYNDFYVYKYATGLISAINIAIRILKEKENAVKDYKKFLKAGGSMAPLEILELVGVDLTTQEPFDIAMKEFKETILRLKSLQ